MNKVFAQLIILSMHIWSFLLKNLQVYIFKKVLQIFLFQTKKKKKHIESSALIICQNHVEEDWSYSRFLDQLNLRFEEKNREGVNGKVKKPGGRVSHKRPKALTHHTVPGRAVRVIKLLLECPSEVGWVRAGGLGSRWFWIVIIDEWSGEAQRMLLHVGRHVRWSQPHVQADCRGRQVHFLHFLEEKIKKEKKKKLTGLE